MQLIAMCLRRARSHRSSSKAENRGRIEAIILGIRWEKDAGAEICRLGTGNLDM